MKTTNSPVCDGKVERKSGTQSAERNEGKHPTVDSFLREKCECFHAGGALVVKYLRKVLPPSSPSITLGTRSQHKLYCR